MNHHYVVALTDVESLINFSMDEESDLKESMAQYSRVKEELSQFVSTLHANLHEEIHYLGEEKIYEKHVERFLFMHGGSMDIILEKPLILKAQFLTLQRATKFSEALKKTLESCTPDSPIKRMFIDSIQPEEVTQNPLTMEKWMKMHNLYLKKTFTYTIVIIALIAAFQIINEAIEFVLLSWLGIGDIAIPSIIGAVIVAFLFEPVKKRVESILNKYFIK